MAKQYKLPWMKWWPKNWEEDTKHLTITSAGFWIRVLSAMWEQPERGKITMSLGGYSRLIKCTISETKKALEELINTKVCNSNLAIPVKISISSGENEYITLINRRMVREEKARKKARARKRKSRDYTDVTLLSRNNPNGVTHLSQPSHATEDERMRGLEDKKIRRGDEENTNTSPPPDFDSVRKHLEFPDTKRVVCGAVPAAFPSYQKHVDQFMADQKVIDKVWKNMADARSHFTRWLKKQNLQTTQKANVI